MTEVYSWAPICTDSSIAAIYPRVVKSSNVLISNLVPSFLNDLSKIGPTDRLIILRFSPILILNMALIKIQTCSIKFWSELYRGQSSVGIL